MELSERGAPAGDWAVKEKLLEHVFPVPSASMLCPGRPCLAGTRYQVGWPTFCGSSTHRALRRRSPPLAPSGPRWCQLPVFASSWIPGGLRSFPKPCLHFAHGPFFPLRGLAGSHLPGSLAPKTSLSTQLTLRVPRFFLSLWHEFLLFFYPGDQF